MRRKRTDQANTRADDAHLRTGQAEQREERMRISELRYRRLFEAARDGILILDASSGMILDVNPFLIELLGYSREVFLGKKIWELGFFKDIAANEAKFEELLAREYVRYEDLPLKSADGRRIAVEFVSNVYLESGHKVIQCNIRDITERKKHEEDLTQLRSTEEALLSRTREMEENAFQRMMIASSVGGVGIWEYDIVKDTLTWDEQMFALYGIKRESFSGAYEAWNAGLHPDDRHRGDNEIQMAIRGEKEFNTEFRVCWPNGEIHFIKAIANVMREKNGHPVRMIGTNWNITKEKKQELLLQETTERALSADRAKSEFLGVMSHELRTPLNAILGFTEILLNEKTISYDDLGDKLRIIRSSGESLLRILEDILDFARIEGSDLKLQSISFSPAKLAWKAIHIVEPDAKAKSLKLAVILDANLSGTVLGDSDRIQQIILNLLRNAIEFTEEGSVILRLDQMNSGLVCFAVEDTGIGISADHLESIFLPFTQVDNTLSRRHAGIGMGLTISRRLAEKMGSTLIVKSVLGKGSVFSVVLSLPSTSSVSSEDGALGNLDKSFANRFPSRILAVEDSPLNLNLLITMLAKLGYQDVLTATHGGEALAVLEKEVVDLIFMDLQMPIMDGMTATKQIRSAEAKDPSVSTVKIIALTANSSVSVRHECFEAGMNQYISKPFNTRSLAEVIALPY